MADVSGPWRTGPDGGARVAPARAPGPGEAAITTFSMTPEARWQFLTDQVMGGLSRGGMTFGQEDGVPFARMTGQVSTANRGGFIQMRLGLSAPPAPDTVGVRLVMRGNDQRYFVHLRTHGNVLPWHFYRAAFHAARDWTEVRLPFAAFTPSGALAERLPVPGGLISVAVVAYGRDHDAQIDVRAGGFF